LKPRSARRRTSKGFMFAARDAEKKPLSGLSGDPAKKASREEEMPPDFRWVVLPPFYGLAISPFSSRSIFPKQNAGSKSKILDNRDVSLQLSDNLIAGIAAIQTLGGIGL